MSGRESLASLRGLNLNLLPALAALLQERSVSGAAARMNVSQSAMSHSLAKLREVLDDPLLIPAGRTMAPTPRAERLASSLPPLLSELGRALTAPVEFDPETAELQLRIATFDYFELAMLPELLAFLARHAPGIRLSVERFEPRSVQRLVAGEIDFVLGGGTMPMPAVLMQRTLYRDPFRVIVRKDHPNVRGRLSLERYVELDHLLVSIEGQALGAVDRALAAEGRERRVALRVPHFAAAPLVVRGSDMICTIAGTIAERAKELHDLRVLRPPLELPEAEIIAWWPRQHQRDPARRWFRERLFGGAMASPWVRKRMRALERGA
ncbi:MAG: LysR family transcriptional regulator [Deltaproteobacteria bacterium]|nr:LysR family transcriptional regulator [Deltaproteobacteria bacterium]